MEGKPPEEGQEPQPGGWLPPVPPGQETQPGVFAPPPAQPGVFAPAPGQGAEPPPPAPGWQPQAPPPPGGAPPPPPGWQQGWQGGGWQLHPAPPGNSTAITGFVLSVSSVALLFFSAGLSALFLISPGLAIAGTIVGRNGRNKVDRGETTQHRGLGQAGFIVGIVGIVLSILAIVGWVLFFTLVDEDFLDEEENDFFDKDEFSALRTAAAIAGAAARLLA